jgi:threonine/homoserine/homoserine lactone efflux protein
MIENLAVLLAAALPLMASPGPATLSLAAMGSAYGLRASLGYLAGIVAGTATALALVASGVSGLILALPGAASVVAVAACAYILYLAWKIATAPPLARSAAGRGAPTAAAGYLLAVANPKAYAAIGAVYSGTTVVDGDLAADTTAKLATLFVLIAAINTVWLLFGSGFAAVLSQPRLGRAVNATFALLLVASVAAALLSLRT